MIWCPKEAEYYNLFPEAYTFREIADAPPIQTPFVITNIVPGDYNHDGRLDLLIMGEDSPGGWWASNELKMLLFRGLGNGQFCRVLGLLAK